MTQFHFLGIASRSLLSAALFIGMTFQIAAQSKPKWEEYRSYDGRFRVLTPGAMRLKADTVSTAIGTLTYHTYFFEDADKDADNVVYMLSYCDYPEGSLHHDSSDLVRDFLQATVEESAFSVAGTVTWSNSISVGRYPGRFWRVDYKDGRAVIKTKAFVAGRRYYSIQTVMRKSRSLNIAADKFLDSFRLLE